MVLGGPRPAPPSLQPVDIGSWQCMPGTPRYKRFFRQPFFDTLAVNRSCVIARNPTGDAAILPFAAAQRTRLIRVARNDPSGKSKAI